MSSIEELGQSREPLLPKDEDHIKRLDKAVKRRDYLEADQRIANTRTFSGFQKKVKTLGKTDDDALFAERFKSEENKKAIKAFYGRFKGLGKAKSYIERKSRKRKSRAKKKS